MKEKIRPWFASLFLLPLVLFIIINKGNFIPLIDHVNLLFHEGGHGIFRPFGKFIYTLGGSLMQLLIPLMFSFYFIWNKKRVGFQISIIYLSQNLMNISVYIGDSIARKLPLLGGNNVYHDWNYLLAEMGVLSYDTSIAFAVYIIAVIICVIALLLPLFWSDYEITNINFN